MSILILSPLALASLAACGGESPGDTAQTATSSATETPTETTTETTTAEAVTADALHLPGPYAVGYRADTVSYADAFSGQTRALNVGVWYPTDDASGEPAVYLEVIEDPDSWADATPAAGPWPLALYSHGSAGYAEASSFLMRHLASHGFVVAAPEHAGNTTWDGADRTADIYTQRPVDVSTLLDHMTSTDLDLTEKAVGVGHSFGGYTLHALAGAAYDTEAISERCESADSDLCDGLSDAHLDAMAAGFIEPRLSAFVSMAPGDFDLFGAAGLGATGMPILHMSGALDPQGEEMERIWEALQGGGNRRVHLLTGGHQTFTDFSGILESGDDLISAEDGFDIVGAYTLAFALFSLGRDDLAPVLDGDVTLFDDVEVMR